MVSLRALIAELSVHLQSAGIEYARREMLMLAAHVLDQPLARILANMDQKLEPDAESMIRSLAIRRAAREPLAYLTGTVDFAGLELSVGPGVLVPRPDSETLVDAAVRELLAEQNGKRVQILDTCTGSGAIGIAIAVRVHHADLPFSLHLIDISETALGYARRNAERWCAEMNVTIERGDLFPTTPVQFDLVTANPPYISDTVLPGLMPEVSRHEPELALAGGPDGLDPYRLILSRVQKYLKPRGLLMMEHGFDQADRVADLVRKTGGFSEPVLLIDLGDNPRVTVCRRSE